MASSYPASSSFTTTHAHDSHPRTPQTVYPAAQGQLPSDSQPQLSAASIPHPTLNPKNTPSPNANERTRTRSAPSTKTPSQTATSTSMSMSTNTPPLPFPFPAPFGLGLEPGPSSYSSTSSSIFKSARSGAHDPVNAHVKVKVGMNARMTSEVANIDEAAISGAGYGNAGGGGSELAERERVRASSSSSSGHVQGKPRRPPPPIPTATFTAAEALPVPRRAGPFASLPSENYSHAHRPAHLATPPGLGGPLQHQHPPVSFSSPFSSSPSSSLLSTPPKNMTTTKTSSPTPSTSTSTPLSSTITTTPPRRPSLASPLPPTPLVPVASTPLINATRFAPAPLNLAGSSSLGSSPSGLAVAAAAAGKIRLHNRRASGSVSGPGFSSPPVSPHPSPPTVTQSQKQTQSHIGHGRTSSLSSPLPAVLPQTQTPPQSQAHSHATQAPIQAWSHPQFVTVSRPAPGPASLPDSPSTTAMMKRLLSKPAPVCGAVSSSKASGGNAVSGLGLGFTSGSESEGWTSAGHSLGYTRRKKEAAAIPGAVSGSSGGVQARDRSSMRPRAKTAMDENETERERRVIRGAADIQFDMRLGSDALDLELDIGQWGSGPEQQLLPVLGGHMDRESDRVLSPSSSTARSPSVSSPLSAGGKEKKKPNVLRRRPSAAAANSAQPHPYSNVNLHSNPIPTSIPIPIPTLSPQPLFSPLSLNLPPRSPINPHPYSNPHVNIKISPSSSSSSSPSTSPTFPTFAPISSSPQDRYGSAFASGPTSSNDPSSNSGHAFVHDQYKYTRTHTHAGDSPDQSHSHSNRQQIASHQHHHDQEQRQRPSQDHRRPSQKQNQNQMSTTMQRSASASALSPPNPLPSPHRETSQPAPASTSTSETAINILHTLDPAPSHTETASFNLRPPVSQHSRSRGSSRESSRGRGSSDRSSPARSPIVSTLVGIPGSGSTNMAGGMGAGGGGGSGTPSPISAVLGPTSAAGGRDGGKEKEKGRTPAASLIEAYKRQEKEREELERMAREDEVLDLGLDEEVVPLPVVLPLSPLRKKTQVGDKAGRILDLDANANLDFAGGRGVFDGPRHQHQNSYKSHSQPSSRRHSINVSMLDVDFAYPSTTASTSGSATPAAAATANAVAPSSSARRTLTVDTSSTQRRKAVHSFASMDSGLDLVPRVDVADAGFSAIEKIVGGSTQNDPPATQPNSQLQLQEIRIKQPLPPHTSLSPEESTPTEVVTPYYTVFGSTSGRVVAVGGREDSWDSYGLGYWDSGVLGRRTTVGAGAGVDKGKGKARPSLGRSLSKKVSGRWRKHGGVVVGVLSDDEQEKEKEREGRVMGRSSMQERRKTGSSSRKRAEDEERRVKMKNRRSLRLSIEKFADEDGRFKHHPSPDIETDDGEADYGKELPILPKLIKAQDDPSSSSPSPGPAGGRFWKLMRRISVGGGLRDKFLGAASATAEIPPPVPPLPKKTLHASRSTDSSLKFLRQATSSKSSGSTSTASSPTPGVDNSTPVASPSTHKPQPVIPPPSAAAAPNHPRPSTTTRSSSPVSSSDVGSSKFFHRAHSSHSSTSSFSEEAPPPLPKPPPMLSQHIIAPSELRRVHEEDNNVNTHTGFKQHPPGMGIIALPSPRDPKNMTDEDWMIVRSPSVELPSLTLPPRRFMAPLPLPSPVVDSASAGGGGAVPSPVADADIDRSESPTIPSFSTSISDAVNAFPSRRLSTLSSSLSARSRNSPSSSLPSPHLNPQPHSAGGFGSSSSLGSSSLSHSLSLPAPPRPLRSAQRPTAAPALAQRSASASASTTAVTSSPMAASSPSPFSSSSPSSYRPQYQPRAPPQFVLPPLDIDADIIPQGRRSESHVNLNQNTSNVPKLNTHHNRRSSGGMSIATTSTIRPSYNFAQRRSSSFGAPSLAASVSGSASYRSVSPALDSPLEKDESGKDKEKQEQTKFALTEQEKAAKWADLLERSEKAGGTLRVELGMGMGKRRWGR